MPIYVAVSREKFNAPSRLHHLIAVSHVERVRPHIRRLHSHVAVRLLRPSGELFVDDTTRPQKRKRAYLFRDDNPLLLDAVCLPGRSALLRYL